jgi:hypothetical protein
MAKIFFSLVYRIRTYLKKWILVQGAGGAGFQTAGIRRYFEYLETGPNTQIGPEDFFEIGSMKIPGCGG